MKKKLEIEIDGCSKLCIWFDCKKGYRTRQYKCWCNNPNKSKPVEIKSNAWDLFAECPLPDAEVKK